MMYQVFRQCRFDKSCNVDRLLFFESPKGKHASFLCQGLLDEECLKAGGWGGGGSLVRPQADLDYALPRADFDGMVLGVEPGSPRRKGWV